MKPFDEGRLAFKKGKISNPYNPDTSRYRDWQFGFDRAYFENLETVKDGENRKAQKASSWSRG